MKITKQEVKTICTIVLDTVDFADIIEQYKNSEGLKAMFPNAFKDMSVTAEMPEKNIIKVMSEIQQKGNSDTFNVIAKCSGFDGWVNAGLYIKYGFKYEMVVYSYGDKINR